MFFSSHARSVTIPLPRRDAGEEHKPRYLVDQLATRANIRVLYRTEVVAAHGDTSLEGIDVRDAGTGETTRLASGGLFIFIGADAETAWLPPEIALDHKGYVLTGSDGRRGTVATRPGPVPPRDERPGRLRLRRRPICSRRGRVAAAVGEGSMAIAFVHQYLRDTEARSRPSVSRAGAHGEGGVAQDHHQPEST